MPPRGSCSHARGDEADRAIRVVLSSQLSAVTAQLSVPLERAVIEFLVFWLPIWRPARRQAPRSPPLRRGARTPATIHRGSTSPRGSRYPTRTAHSSARV